MRDTAAAQAAALRQYVHDTLAAAPPLTLEQRKRIAATLRGRA